MDWTDCGAGCGRWGQRVRWGAPRQWRLCILALLSVNTGLRIVEGWAEIGKDSSGESGRGEAEGQCSEQGMGSTSHTAATADGYEEVLVPADLFDASERKEPELLELANRLNAEPLANDAKAVLLHTFELADDETKVSLIPAVRLTSTRRVVAVLVKHGSSARAPPTKTVGSSRSASKASLSSAFTCSRARHTLAAEVAVPGATPASK